MNAIARPWVGLVFKCLSILALIFALIFFMRMQEEQSEIGRLKNQGVVSRATVTDKQLDKMVYEGRRGRTRSVDLQILHVRHVPDSKVKYADFPAKVKEADLPVAPPVSGDAVKDSKYLGVMFVPVDLYEKSKVGDMLTVVNTPFNTDAPELVSEVRAFDAGIYYPRIAIALVLMLAFWIIGWRIAKAARRR